MSGRLDSVRAVVTGGGTGIGRGIARVLVQQGAEVAVLGRRQALLEETVAGLGELGGKEIGYGASGCDHSGGVSLDEVTW